jgi:hypothetical protein
MNARLSQFLAATLFISACTSPSTQVIVTIDAEPGVKMDSTKLQVVVLGGSGRVTAPTASRFDRVLTPGGADPAYPITLGLAPLDGDVGRSYTVTATAQTAAGGFVGQVRIIGGYVEGETSTVRLMLEDMCRTVMCGAEQTCRAGVCVDAREEMLLPPADGGTRDAGAVDFTPRNLPAGIWGSAVGRVSVDSAATINTDSGAVVVDGVASRDFTPVDVAAVGDCRAIFALVTQEFRVASGATVSVTGSRGLAIVSTGPVVIDGTLDVGAHGLVPGPGGTVRAFGGGYGSAGGLAGCQSGGTIPTFGSADLSGLCGGSTAAGGGGAGGALQVTSLAGVALGSSGIIRAVGGGGGSPGGSGGGVLVQAPEVMIAGVISVNGGGGGGYSGPGEDGRLSEAAPGALRRTITGTCGPTTTYYGGGGAGAWQNGAATNGGGSGVTSECGGPSCNSDWLMGGGGGGAGRIRIEATVRDYRPGRVLEYPGLAGVFTDGPLNYPASR